MTAKISYVYVAIAKGNDSAMYPFSDFLGIAFTFAELRELIMESFAGPCPGKRFELWRRKIGGKKTQYMTFWSSEELEGLEWKKWW